MKILITITVLNSPLFLKVISSLHDLFMTMMVIVKKNSVGLRSWPLLCIYLHHCCQYLHYLRLNGTDYASSPRIPPQVRRVIVCMQLSNIDTNATMDFVRWKRARTESAEHEMLVSSQLDQTPFGSGQATMVQQAIRAPAFPELLLPVSSPRPWSSVPAWIWREARKDGDGKSTSVSRHERKEKKTEACF